MTHRGRTRPQSVKTSTFYSIPCPACHPLLRRHIRVVLRLRAAGVHRRPLPLPRLLARVPVRLVHPRHLVLPLHLPPVECGRLLGRRPLGQAPSPLRRRVVRLLAAVPHGPQLLPLHADRLHLRLVLAPQLALLGGRQLQVAPHLPLEEEGGVALRPQLCDPEADVLRSPHRRVVHPHELPPLHDACTHTRTVGLHPLHLDVSLACVPRPPHADPLLRVLQRHDDLELRRRRRPVRVVLVVSAPCCSRSRRSCVRRALRPRNHGRLLLQRRRRRHRGRRLQLQQLLLLGLLLRKLAGALLRSLVQVERLLHVRADVLLHAQRPHLVQQRQPLLQLLQPRRALRVRLHRRVRVLGLRQQRRPLQVHQLPRHRLVLLPRLLHRVLGLRQRRGGGRRRPHVLRLLQLGHLARLLLLSRLHDGESPLLLHEPKHLLRVHLPRVSVEHPLLFARREARHVDERRRCGHALLQRRLRGRRVARRRTRLEGRRLRRGVGGGRGSGSLRGRAFLLARRCGGGLTAGLAARHEGLRRRMRRRGRCSFAAAVLLPRSRSGRR
eukprot:Rhum_TRINITY_DN14117_c9_g1::Rhum_TRINITY_DN14117_c9_g1_i1::g.72125::m.72125